MKAKTKLTKLWSILIALVMLVGLLPTTALAAERDAVLRFADDAAGDYFYNVSGNFSSEGPTVDTTFSLTEPTKITAIWTYHWYAANYDIDFSEQTIQLKDTNTDTVVYSGAVYVGHYWNPNRDCDWFAFPDIVLPAGTYQLIDSHNESWCALNNKGVCMIKGYSGTFYEINTPGEIIQNGVTATVTFNENGPLVADTAVTATVTLTGTAVTSGTHTVNLTSTKIGMNGMAQTVDVTAGQDLTTTPVTNTFSFTMPAEDVDDLVLLHTFESESPHTVTITNGTASVSQATAGTTVTLTADAAPSGQVFDKWVVESESASITFADANSATTTFTMPANAVSVKATYKAIYAVSVTYGTASPSGAQAAGTSVTITADAAPVGKRFKQWTGADGLTFTDGSKTSATAIFTMPDRAVALIATYEDITVATTYTVTFNANGGSVTPASAVTDTDGKLTSLPTPTRSRYSFNGWYTEASGGTKVDTNYVFNANTTIYAHWTYTGGGGGGSTVTTNTVTADSVKNGDVAISPKYAAKGTIVTLKIEPDKGYKLDTVTVTDKNGNKIELTDKGNGEYTFKMPATKVNVETTFVEETTTEDNTMMNLFVDIPDDTYYYDAVLWAAKNGITGGMDDTHFAPDITCTRVQAITFLWRAAGSPMPKSSEISFEDVETDSYYYYAVLWALENGITSGTSATTFSPDDTCSRGQIVTFLWRAEKSPTVGMDNTFTDVSSDSYYADATNWAVANGITSGTSDTTFSPDETCTRGQIVTFLYRFFVK